VKKHRPSRPTCAPAQIKAQCENKTPTTAAPFPQSSLTRVAPRHPDSDPVPFGGGRPAADETLTTALRSPDVGSGAAEAGEAHAWRGRAAERARGGRERRQRSCGGRRVHAELVCFPSLFHLFSFFPRSYRLQPLLPGAVRTVGPDMWSSHWLVARLCRCRITGLGHLDSNSYDFQSQFEIICRNS